MNLDTIVTPRWRAERLRPDHLDEIRRMHRDERVMATLGGLRSEEQTREYLRVNLDHWERHGFGLWIVRAPAGGAPVGRALVRHLEVDGTPEVEIGYALYADWWGRGLATDIASRCLSIGRDALGFAALVAITLPDNRGSRRVMEKAGMRYERDVTHAGRDHVLYRSGDAAGGGA